MHSNYTYLALGDSYTIAEGLPLHESYPYQTVYQLRQLGFNFCAPEIIAKTGWTTDELEEGIKKCQLLPRYDYVTLLIGVNNQFRGRDVMLYKMELEELLKKSIAFSNGKPAHVLMISIPDYSIMPFSAKMNKEKIAKEIDVFNNIGKALSVQYKTGFIDITNESRKAGADDSLVANDGLHLSAKEYNIWAGLISKNIALQLK
jgi:lysophospholipase L1-like esterase